MSSYQLPGIFVTESGTRTGQLAGVSFQDNLAVPDAQVIPSSPSKQIYVPESKIWTKQPREASGLSSTWQQNGLIALFNGYDRVHYGCRTPQNVFGGVPSGNQIISAKYGVGRNRGGSDLLNALYSPITATDNFTMVSVFRVSSATVTVQAGALGLNNNPTNHFTTSLDAATVGQIGFKVNIGGATRNIGGSYVFQAGADVIAIFRHRYNIDQVLFVNGAKDNAIGNFTGSLTNTAYFGYDTFYNTKCFFGALFNNALSDTQIETIFGNPWQLFKPRKQYFPFVSSDVAKRWVPERKVAYRQLATPLSINWSNPLTKNLIFAYIPGTQVNLVTGEKIFSNGRSFSSNKDGTCTSSAGASYIYAELPVNASSSTARFDTQTITVFARIRQSSEVNSGWNFIRGNGTSPPTWGVGLHGGTFDGPYAQLGSYNYTPGSADASMVGNIHTVCIAGNGSTLNLFYDKTKLINNAAYTPSVPEYSPGSWRGIIIGSNGSGTPNNTENSLALLFSGQIDDATYFALEQNPWQLFSPRRSLIPARVVTNVQIDYPQILTPNTDISTGLWYPSTGTTLYGVLDETTYDDSDYIYTKSSSQCEIKFSAGGVPTSNDNHKIKYRILPGSGSIVVTLLNGSNTIKIWNHTLTNSPQDIINTLTIAEALNITDYTNLRIRINS